MKRLAVIAALAAAVIVSCCYSEIARELVFGWATFLITVVPQVRVDLATVAAATAAFGLCTLGVHYFARKRPPADASGRQSRFGWALACTLLVVVAFGAGICMIGATHQTVWLLRSDEPVTVETSRLRYDPGGTSGNRLRSLAMGLEISSRESLFPGKSQQSWLVETIVISGFTGSTANGEHLDPDLPWNDPKNRPVFCAVYPPALNPSMPTAPVFNSDGYALAHYAANCRAMDEGAFRRLAEFQKGAAHTLIIGEVNANFRPWGDPANVRDPARGINRSPYGFGGPVRSKGALFAMADGSVRFISERVDSKVLRSLAAPEESDGVDLGSLDP